MKKSRIIIMLLFTILISFCVGAYSARYIWADEFQNFRYIQEYKQQKIYCPYCGEYVGRNVE